MKAFLKCEQTGTIDLYKLCFPNGRTVIDLLVLEISDENFEKVLPCMKLLVNNWADGIAVIKQIWTNQNLSNVNKGSDREILCIFE